MAAEAVARRLAPINTAMATAGEPAPRLGFVGIGTINVAVLKGLIKADPGPRSQKMCLGPRNAAKAGASAVAADLSRIFVTIALYAMMSFIIDSVAVIANSFRFLHAPVQPLFCPNSQTP
eukprot:SAG31_NODE_3849_length_3818_cov_3.043560_5_plen_120_part_00